MQAEKFLFPLMPYWCFACFWLIFNPGSRQSSFTFDNVAYVCEGSALFNANERVKGRIEYQEPKDYNVLCMW